MIRKYAFCLGVILRSAVAAAAIQDPAYLLRQMEKAVKDVTSYSVFLDQQELFDHGLGPKIKMKVKALRDKAYLKVLAGPQKGAELIFATGWNDGKVRVHKGSFPDFSLSLDPHNAILMEYSHHPISEVKFDFIVPTIMKSVRKCLDQKAGSMRYLKEEAVRGQNSDILELVPPWKTTQYKTVKGDDAWIVANKFGSHAYFLRHTNHFKKNEPIPIGYELQIPEYYGSRLVLALDQQNHLPTRMEIYDADGKLYERYEWSELDRKTLLGDRDFDPKNPDYDF